MFLNELEVHCTSKKGIMAFSFLCRFAPWLIRPLARSPNVQGEQAKKPGANQPGDEQGRGANEPVGGRARGE